MIIYKTYITTNKYPEDGEIRGNKFEDWKRKLQPHQTLFSAKPTAIASHKIIETMATKKQPFGDSNVIKESLSPLVFMDL
jgi:hypothetical protein